MLSVVELNSVRVTDNQWFEAKSVSCRSQTIIFLEN